MRIVLLFIVFFLVGIAIVLGMHYWDQQLPDLNVTKPSATSQFSLEHAPSDSLQGTIATMSGNIMWLSRTASKPVKLSSPRAIQQGEEISTGSNGKVVVRIRNDTSLLLLPDTHVSIIQLLPQNFVFVQDKGSIHYENTIQVPVSVKTFDVVTLLTQGIMTVAVDPKKQVVRVSVESGTVREGYEDLQNNSIVMTVNAGQTFVFDEINKVGSVQ